MQYQVWGTFPDGDRRQIFNGNYSQQEAQAMIAAGKRDNPEVQFEMISV